MIKEWVCFDRFNQSCYEELVSDLEADFEWTRISKKDMILGKDYVALRFAGNDYHFMWRGKKGHWRHKMGRQPVEAISQKEVFSRYWYGDYFGTIFLFEVKR